MSESRPNEATCGYGRIACLLIASLGLSTILSATQLSPSTILFTTQLSPSPTSVRLTITNGCTKDPLWIANFAFQAPFFTQDFKLNAGDRVNYTIPNEGLAATRFWAKWGCDDSGSNCLIGQSGGPGESCPAKGCAPPIDSKFEATFGCMPGTDKCAVNPSDPSQTLLPIDFWDTSLMDGWTLPYKVEVVGNCPNMKTKTIDCSKLTLDACPTNENLNTTGIQSLLLTTKNGTAVGCFAPCTKLTSPVVTQGLNFPIKSPEAAPYCCPTPPISPDACRKGPIVNTQFVQTVHTLCPNVYAYSYDDGVGLATCPAGTRYDVTFYCPSEAMKVRL